MSNIEDTIYDLPNEEYHRGERFKDFLSSTQIKDYMVSPKFADTRHCTQNYLR